MSERWEDTFKVLLARKRIVYVDFYEFSFFYSTVSHSNYDPGSRGSLYYRRCLSHYVVFYSVTHKRYGDSLIVTASSDGLTRCQKYGGQLLLQTVHAPLQNWMAIIVCFLLLGGLANARVLLNLAAPFILQEASLRSTNNF